MLTFIAPAHNEVSEGYMFIGSLLSQTNPNWEAIIINNGPNSQLEAIVEQINDSRVRYINSILNTGYWGCYNRIEALNDLVDTEYIIQSSIQDYFIPSTVDKILKFQNTDIISWNSINHLFGYSNILNTSLEVGKIDWGNFAVKTEIAKKVGIRMPEEFCADGIFVTDMVRSGLLKTKVKISEVLTIHN